MALTPEDVVNKRFQPTKFREGYDQDEVDDFLDEVVVELRRLNQENEELKQRLVASDSRIAELQRGGGQQAAPTETAPQAAPAVSEPQEAAPAVPAAPTAPVAEPAATIPTTSSVDSDTTSTNNLLQLARRLHEEHVREGIEKRDALVAEGHATAARIVAEAETKQREQITALENERGSLERRIDQLRTFERDYRTQLRGYIEGQLRDLDASSEVGGVPASSGAVPVSAVNAGAQGESDGAGTQPQSYQGFGA